MASGPCLRLKLELPQLCRWFFHQKSAKSRRVAPTIQYHKALSVEELGFKGQACQVRGKLRATADGRLLSRMAHPVEWAASPLSPGPAASRGRRASLLAGPRAASRRLRHLRANAPRQPGPTTASTRGRRRAAARGALSGPRAL